MKKIDRIKLKEETENLKVQTKNKEKKHKEKSDFSRIFKITFFAFFISFFISMFFETTLPKANFLLSLVLVIIFVLLGILFDIIGVAVTSCSIVPFNSMSSRKVYGAKTAVKLIQNANKVSSFCNDVIGDVCGIISGTGSAVVSVNLANLLHTNQFITTLFTTAFIAAFTIGGKALGKSYAMNKNSIIVFKFAKILAHFRKDK